MTEIEPMKRRRSRTIVFDRDKDRHIVETADDTMEVREGNIRLVVDKDGNKTFDVAIKCVNIFNLGRVKNYRVVSHGNAVVHKITFLNGETAVLDFTEAELIGFKTTCPIMISQEGVLELHDMRRPD